MKKIFTVVCLLICVNMYAQKCSDYLFLQNNKYNKKGEENGKQIYTVSNVTNTGDVTTATLNSEMFDKKGKSIVKASNHIKCVSGVMMMNMKMMLPQQQAEQFGKAEATAEDVYIDYPSTMNAGDQLKDGSFSMDIDNNGLKQTINMSVTNRKVEGKESVTTTAGTWDCFKISYKSKMVIKTAGIGIPINIDGTEWYAAGVGVVKTQSKSGGTAITAIK